MTIMVFRYTIFFHRCCGDGDNFRLLKTKAMRVPSAPWSKKSPPQTQPGFPSHVNGFGVQIEGLIDLGPKWNYEYKVSPVNYQEITPLWYDLFKSFDTSPIIRKENEIDNVKHQRLSIRKGKTTKTKLTDSVENHSVKNETYSIKEHIYEKEDIDTLKSMIQSVTKRPINTKMIHSTRLTFNVEIDNKKQKKQKAKKKVKDHKLVGSIVRTPDFQSSDSNFFQKNHIYDDRLHDNVNKGDHKVVDDPKVFDFTLHIFKQNLKIFDDIIRATQLYRVKREIKSLKKSYAEQFKNYLSDNKDFKIRTMLGHQKVIYNTIDTSNNILKKLVHRQMLRSMSDEHLKETLKKFQHECDIHKVIEDKHACIKFGLCRSNEDFSDFLNEIISIILLASDSKVKQAADALTEVLKTSDFTSVIDVNEQIKLRQLIHDVELSNPNLIRNMFLILKSAINNKDRPIVIKHDSDIGLANKSIAFQNLLDIINKNVSNTTEKGKWDEIKGKLLDWKDGAVIDITHIFETIVNQLKTAFDKMSFETSQQVNDNIKILLAR